ncbi:DUF3300 domain-containing protein [Rhodobacter sp. CZR27]|uniref:DUF3300 domain-containing protein n=1 Tax=Rhodobacter sp. CZR27 TaxID=2033869 RepID=UPI000BBE28EA|nr:DUF3300 domain-containing protein [Rhodobacter sp. CZR27]
MLRKFNPVLVAMTVAAGMTAGAPLWAQEATVTPAPAAAPAAPAAPAPSLLSPDEIDTLMAPVALFPDQLLTQIFMATTYPLDVVKADRFLKSSTALSDKERADAVETKDWDQSVQALAAGFPDLIGRMAEHIDWTEQVGDAVLVQTDDVLDSIQRLRAQAEEAGHLASNEAQTVTVAADDTITIAPANPQVVYVPTYDTETVYVPSTAPPPTETVIYGDGGADVGDALLTGAMVFGSAMILDEIFDDDDDHWHGYWGSGDIDWDDGDLRVGRDIDIDGDVNIDRNRVDIDRNRISGDRITAGGDRTAIAGNRIGDLDREGLDRERDRNFRPDMAKRDEARKKIETRKSTGQPVARLNDGVQRPAGAGQRAGTSPRPKQAAAKRPSKPKASASSRPTKVSKPSRPSKPRAHAASKPPPAFQRSGGSRAKAASSRGRSSAGRSGGRGRR